MGSHFDSAAASEPVKVLILGGSYGGLSAALNLVDLCEGRPARQGRREVSRYDGQIPVQVTIVDERDGFYHLIGQPLALADTTYASKTWLPYATLPALQTPKITTLQGTALSINPATKTAVIRERTTTTTTTTTTTERTLAYDYLVVATGLGRAWPVAPRALHKKAYLAETAAHTASVTAGGRGGNVVVIGGGAVGVEMAAELKLVSPATRVTLVHSRAMLLSAEKLPDECKVRAAELVREAGVELRLGRRVTVVEGENGEGEGAKKQKVRFDDGGVMDAGAVVWAVSAGTPRSEALPAECKDASGYVRVRPNLMFPATSADEGEGEGVPVANADAHFAVGDVARWSGIKRCGGAMHMGFFAAYNIHELVAQKITGEEPQFQEMEELPPVIALAVGKKAVSYTPAQGVKAGEDVRKACFEEDLGFDICWRWMRLGQETGGSVDVEK